MTANTDTLILFQGSDFGFTLALTNESDGSPVDLTGASAAYQARGSEDDPLPLFDLDSSAKGGISLGATSGLLTVTIPASTSSAMLLPAKTGAAAYGAGGMPCRYAADQVEVRLANGKTTTVRRGLLAIVREVVR